MQTATPPLPSARLRPSLQMKTPPQPPALRPSSAPGRGASNTLAKPSMRSGGSRSQRQVSVKQQMPAVLPPQAPRSCRKSAPGPAPFNAPRALRRSKDSVPAVGPVSPKCTFPVPPAAKKAPRSPKEEASRSPHPQTETSSPPSAPDSWDDVQLLVPPNPLSFCRSRSSLTSLR